MRAQPINEVTKRHQASAIYNLVQDNKLQKNKLFNLRSKSSFFQMIFYFSPSKSSKRGIKEVIPTPFSISFQQRTHSNLIGSLLLRMITPRILLKERAKVATKSLSYHNVAKCGQSTSLGYDKGNIY